MIEGAFARGDFLARHRAHGGIAVLRHVAGVLQLGQRRAVIAITVDERRQLRVFLAQRAEFGWVRLHVRARQQRGDFLMAFGEVLEFVLQRRFHDASGLACFEFEEFARRSDQVVAFVDAGLAQLCARRVDQFVGQTVGEQS